MASPSTLQNFKVIASNFSSSMQDYLKTILDFYKTKLDNLETFSSSIHEVLEKQWKSKLFVYTIQCDNEEEPPYKIWCNRSHYSYCSFVYNDKKYFNRILLYKYSESANMEVRSSNGLEYDELNLLKGVTFFLANSQDIVQDLIRVFSGMYSKYDVFVLDDSPTWCSNASKRFVFLNIYVAFY